jgi:hypothetical protein
MMDSHVHQHTVLLGARWDLARNTALKVQLDMIDGTADSVFPYRRETAAFAGKVNVIGATLDFVF